tara:strand:- start:437 stop:616 length:180 start_codon:yes stop_codon:yes gene_type:complete
MTRLGELVTEVRLLKKCVLEAEAHVCRQVHAGKHEQDRLDAVTWEEKWADNLRKWKGRK